MNKTLRPQMIQMGIRIIGIIILSLSCKSVPKNCKYMSYNFLSKKGDTIYRSQETELTIRNDTLLFNKLVLFPGSRNNKVNVVRISNRDSFVIINRNIFHIEDGRKHLYFSLRSFNKGDTTLHIESFYIGGFRRYRIKYLIPDSEVVFNKLKTFKFNVLYDPLAQIQYTTHNTPMIADSKHKMNIGYIYFHPILGVVKEYNTLEGVIETETKYLYNKECLEKALRTIEH